MVTIWKYEIPAETPFRFDMPTKAQILHVERQGEFGCLWAMVDLEAPREPRWFHQVGTGREVPAEATRYVGTYLMPPTLPENLDQTIYVFHVFEEGKD